jgi:hypothetical protein
MLVRGETRRADTALAANSTAGNVALHAPGFACLARGGSRTRGGDMSEQEQNQERDEREELDEDLDLQDEDSSRVVGGSRRGIDEEEPPVQT